MTNIKWDWRLIQSRIDVSKALVSIEDAEQKLELPNGACSAVFDLVDGSDRKDLTLIKDIMIKLDDLSWGNLFVTVDEDIKVPSTPSNSE